MKIKFKLKQDVVARKATNLTLYLNELTSNIRICCHEHDVNGKSLLGIYTAQMKLGDEVTILFDVEEEKEKIMEIFKEVGEEI